MGITEDIKTSNFQNQKTKAMVNLMYTNNWFRDLFKTKLKPHNLQNQHFNVLRIINGKHPEPTTPGEIREVMIDKGPDITRLVDKLVNMKLVERCLKATNRRVVEINLTEKGLTLVQKLIKESQEIVDGSIGLSEEESGQLSDLLDKLRAANAS